MLYYLSDFDYTLPPDWWDIDSNSCLLLRLKGYVTRPVFGAGQIKIIGLRETKTFELSSAWYYRSIHHGEYNRYLVNVEPIT